MFSKTAPLAPPPPLAPSSAPIAPPPPLASSSAPIASPPPIAEPSPLLTEPVPPKTAQPARSLNEINLLRLKNLAQRAKAIDDEPGHGSQYKDDPDFRVGSYGADEIRLLNLSSNVDKLAKSHDNVIKKFF